MNDLPAFSLIVPARNEALQLGKTAPVLREALSGLTAEVIFVLNGTNDESADVIAQTFGSAAKVIDLADAGKTRALRSGDEASAHGFRVYLDADVMVGRNLFRQLLAPLRNGEADLTAPRLIADLTGCHGLAFSVARVWSDQLARRPDAFMCCTAFSPAGIARRDVWPDLIADDDWARNRIEPQRRRIIESATAVISPPRTVLGWLRVRSRWASGARELRRLGFAEKAPRRTTPRGVPRDLAIYYSVRLLAQGLSYFSAGSAGSWARDDSTRRRLKN